MHRKRLTGTLDVAVGSVVAGRVAHAFRVRFVRSTPVADVVTGGTEPADVTVETDWWIEGDVTGAAVVTVRLTGAVRRVAVVA